jgi:hypothetical protein
LFIPYSALTDSVNGGVNLSKVDSILLDFQSQVSMSLTQVSAVPEPVMLTPALGLALLRSRRTMHATARPR